MLTEYLNKAMQHAHFERLEDETNFGSFPDLPDLKGVWADADTEDNCRAELREVPVFGDLHQNILGSTICAVF